MLVISSRFSLKSMGYSSEYELNERKSNINLFILPNIQHCLLKEENDQT